MVQNEIRDDGVDRSRNKFWCSGRLEVIYELSESARVIRTGRRGDERVGCLKAIEGIVAKKVCGVSFNSWFRVCFL